MLLVIVLMLVVISLADPVRVQLVKSFCLPLITYCVGAMKLKRSDLQQMSVC